jgi:transposase
LLPSRSGGFWLHRYLTGRGDINYVVDLASIEVDRRARRTKTDAVDLRGLLALLARYVAGIGAAGGWCGSQVWRMKTRASCTGRGKRCREIGRVINRLKAVLAAGTMHHQNDLQPAPTDDPTVIPQGYRFCARSQVTISGSA